MKVKIDESGNVKDVPLSMVTSENYIVPKGEEGVYHCLVENQRHDQKTGARLSRPFIRKFGKKVFDSIMRKGMFAQGLNVQILHDPTEWLKTHADLAPKAITVTDVDAAVQKALTEQADRFNAILKEATEKAANDAIAATLEKYGIEKKPKTQTKKQAANADANVSADVSAEVSDDNVPMS